MPISKRVLLAAGCALLMGLSTAAVAQTPKGNAKSNEKASQNFQSNFDIDY